jgi:hypothetical protein
MPSLALLVFCEFQISGLVKIERIASNKADGIPTHSTV